MFRKLRRRWAHKSIRKFLKDFLPDIELGEMEEFKCLNFRLGEYSVKTTKGEYKMYFWELIHNAKEFHIDLCGRQNRKWERLTFFITGNVIFRIIPWELTIDKENKRQVTRLLNGETTIYPIGEDSHLCTIYKRPIMESEIVNISRVIQLTYNYL